MVAPFDHTPIFDGNNNPPPATAANPGNSDNDSVDASRDYLPNEVERTGAPGNPPGKGVDEPVGILPPDQGKPDIVSRFANGKGPLATLAAGGALAALIAGGSRTALEKANKTPEGQRLVAAVAGVDAEEYLAANKRVNEGANYQQLLVEQAIKEEERKQNDATPGRH